MSLTLLSLLTFQAEAQICNFEKSGNALTGTSYQAKVLLPPSISKNAITAVRTKLESSGQKILSIDIAQGTLLAEQPSKGSSRALQLTASVRPMVNETESIATLRLNPLQLAPDEAVKTELCGYALAANQGVAVAVIPSDVQKSPAATSLVGVAKPTQEAADSEFIKNGIPCLSGVCIGDDVTKIRGVAWLARHPVLKRDLRQASAGEVNLLRPILKASDDVLLQIATAIVAGTFDASAISSLAKVNASCDKLFVLSVVAYFKSESGHVTQVIFQPTANENTTEQVFRITNINRTFEDAVTAKQKQDLQSALVSKYKSVIDTYNLAYSRQGEYPSVQINLGNMRGMLELNLAESTNVSIPRTDRLKQHPVCGGGKSVQIN